VWHLSDHQQPDTDGANISTDNQTSLLHHNTLDSNDSEGDRIVSNEIQNDTDSHANNNEDTDQPSS